MDEKQRQGGYGNPSGPSDGLGANFISLGPDCESDGSHQRWPPWNRRGGRGQQFQSGNRRGGPPFMGRDGPNNQPYNRSFGNGRGRGFHQSNHMRGGGGGGGGYGQRGNRGHNFQRHQGSRPHESSNLHISSYYHPSMMEDPWQELETLFKVPQPDESSSSSQTEVHKNLGSKNVDEVGDSDNSVDSEGSE